MAGNWISFKGSLAAAPLDGAPFLVGRVVLYLIDKRVSKADESFR